MKEMANNMIYNKNTLPEHFTASNFTGCITLAYYYHPHGGGCRFHIVKHAKNCKEYTPP